MKEKSRILGLDVGSKRIGMAVAIEGIVFPRETLLVKSQKEALDSLKQFCAQENITEIVIGLPLDQENQETMQSKKIRAFGEKLESAVNLPVAFQEESYSTLEAAWKMPKYKKEHRDTLAAAVILERYLNAI